MNSKIKGSILLEKVLEEFASKYTIVSLNYLLTPLERNILVPTFTSKLIKTLEAQAGITGFYKKLYLKTNPRKMIFSVVKTMKGEPLYKKASTEDHKPIILYKNRQYKTRITLLLEKRGVETDLLENPDREISTPMGRIRVCLQNISINRPREVSPMTGDIVFKLKFVTPTILTHKIETPPWITKTNRIPEYHRLFPTPGLIAGHTINTLCRYIRFKILDSDKLQYYALRSFNIGVAETDFNIKPVTVLYSLGKEIRKPRGLIGWVIYKPLTSWHKRIFHKILFLSSMIGLGRSRAIGFGEVEQKAIRL